MKRHECDEMEWTSSEFEDTELSITFNQETETWWLYLYDGDGVSTPIKYCPYCSKNLHHD